MAECIHRWVLMSEKIVRLSAYYKQRYRRFYCNRCRKVVEDRDGKFIA